MENGLKKLVDLGASAIHRAYILGTKCQDSVATMHAHRAIIVTLEALGLTDEAVDALLEGKAAVVPLVYGERPLHHMHYHGLHSGSCIAKSTESIRLDKPREGE